MFLGQSLRKLSLIFIGLLPHDVDQGLHFSLIQPSDLLLVDHSGKVLEESGPMQLLNPAAFMIHSAIHAARPDVLCAAHSHSIYGKAFSTLGVELDMITQDSCLFYDVSAFSLQLMDPGGLPLWPQDHVVYRQFNGVVLAKEEGQRIAQTLGSKRVCLVSISSR